MRLAVRPSGTEPKIKCYIEVREPVDGDLAGVRERAEVRLAALEGEAMELLHRGPN